MIFIQGNFPSFKNSKQMTRSGFMVMSKTVQKYLKLWEWQWKQPCFRDAFVDESSSFLIDNTEKPIMIGLHFVRGTKHKYDWVNMVQGVQDLMVKHNWLIDDNVEEVLPFPLLVNGCFSSYDKDNPGVFIKIIK